MKRIIFGMLLFAVCGVSHAGKLVIDNSSQISFSAYDRQLVAAGVVNSSFADSAGLNHGFSNGDKQQRPFGFTTLKGQTNRYGSFDYLLGFNDSYSGGSMAPVSEPHTYAMMLAGLGLLGFSVCRRKDNS